jgi:Protein of unknown function (DUF1579)
MKKLAITSLVAPLLATVALTYAQELPPMPQPTKEHEWLKQFLGEWESEVEVFMVPGQPPMKHKGTEVCRAIGGLWVIGEGKSDMGGMTYGHLLTLGYDPEKKKYIGTWIDSMLTYIWKYEGTVDAAGKVLTLETEGPSMMKPGQMAKYKDVTEFKSKDHRAFSSSMLGDDGKWVTIVKVDSRRKK